MVWADQTVRLNGRTQNKDMEDRCEGRGLASECEPFESIWKLAVTLAVTLHYRPRDDNQSKR
jgi:hypothetical protein